MPQDDDRRRTSFDDFDARMRRLRGGPPPGGDGAAAEEGRGGRRGSGAWTGVQAGIEIVVALAVGVGIGWALDRWLGTMPLFLVAFFMLGAAAGVLNAYRTLNRVNRLDGGDRSAPSEPPKR
ncbi:MAG TPA: AtpZ/AtpI family protein [Geminicoccaceae bacterium]|nr:AtpZ/AtpI family protein [Geminicoccaceae bacterium]